MSDIVRYGVGGGTGTGGQQLPFARAAGADGWLFVSGQVPMQDGEIISGGIVEQSHAAIRNLIAILHEAGYGPEHVVLGDDLANPGTREPRNPRTPNLRPLEPSEPSNPRTHEPKNRHPST